MSPSPCNTLGDVLRVASTEVESRAISENQLQKRSQRRCEYRGPARISLCDSTREILIAFTWHHEKSSAFQNRHGLSVLQLPTKLDHPESRSSLLQFISHVAVADNA